MGPKSENIVWHGGEIDAGVRKEKLGQSGAVVWLTGLSGSGKSTVARRVENLLVQQGVNAYVLDGDNVRHGLNSDLGFAPDDRRENIRRIREVARLMADANIIVLCAFISPYRADRDAARAMLPAGSFFEVHCAADLAVCEERDPKGLYQKARAGDIADFTGISAPYEAPEKPELSLDTGHGDIDKTAQSVIDMLREASVI